MAPPDAERLRQAQTRVAAARLRACADHPYLSSALFAMALMVDPATPPEPGVAVDRAWRCHIAPDVAADTPVDVLAALLLHAVSHLVRDHAARADRLAARGGPLDGAAVNLAQDCEINDDLIEEHLPLPESAPVPQDLGWPSGLLFEDYLAAEVGPAGVGGIGSGGPPAVDGGAGEPGSDAGDQGSDAEAPDDGEATDGEGTDGDDPTDAVTDGEGDGDGGEIEADCGSGSHGTAASWEQETAGPDGIDAREGELIRRRVAHAVRDHDRRKGSVPAGWRRWAEAHIDPALDWRSLLASTVRATLASASGAVDYTYATPSRRGSAVPGVVLPALRRPAPSIAVVIDSSGSMSADDLGLALAEVQGVLARAGVRRDATRVLCCDSAVGWAGRVATVEAIPLTGGGGTDMARGVDEAVSGRPRPDAVIVLTDGYTGWPTERPPVPVVAGILDGGWPEPPPWVTTVVVPRRPVRGGPTSTATG